MIGPNQLHHVRQSTEGRCLPACARMILGGLDILMAEDQIAEILETDFFGTPAFAIRRLESIGLKVNYGSCSASSVISDLEKGVPSILFVKTGFLDHWNIDVAHALVVVGADPGILWLAHDPGLEAGPIQILWNGLLAAWMEFEFRCATIIKR